MTCGLDAVCWLLEWMIQNIDVLLTLVIGFGVLIMVYLAGHVDGHKAGFVDGIAHYIQLKAYDAADFPEKYAGDKYVLKAQARLAKNLKPKIPADITDET